jgi:hypothetical protein
MDFKSQAESNIEGLTSDAIRFQLNRILSSSFFSSSPQLGRFLKFVVEKALSGQVNYIKQYTIAVDAFGYPADYNPQTDPAMRVLELVWENWTGA